MLIRLMTAIALAATMAACAHAGPGPVVAAIPAPNVYAGRAPIEEAPLVETGLLAELPANAPPGECYARVGVPSGPAAPPPPVAQATWVQTAGPPGSPGPIWCLVPVCQQCVSAPPPAPEMKYGWIRVICEKDLTVDRVRKVQTKLHDRGYYQGPVTGSYDQTTATAVSRFQEQAHISHGGYLSIQTVEALDSNAVYAQPSVQVAASASASGNASASVAVGAAPPVVAYGQQYGQSAQYSQYSSQYGGYSATYGAGAYPQVQTYPPVSYAQPQYGQPQYAAPQYAAPQYPQVGYPQPGYPPMAYPQPGYGYPQQAGYGGAGVAAAAAAAASGGGGGNYGVQYGGRGLPEPAYRGRTAVQDGFLTWPSKQAFY